MSAPLKTPLKIITQFINQKFSWIEKHRSLLRLKLESSKSFVSSGIINFKGEKYQLDLRYAAAQEHVVLIDNKIYLYINSDVSAIYQERMLKEWYEVQMWPIVNALMAKWKEIMHVCVTKVSIRDMTSRWGSCNPVKQHISLNLKLIEKPIECLEYVIAHELVHMFEPSHNKRFYTLMSHYLPEWKNIKKILNEFV